MHMNKDSKLEIEKQIKLQLELEKLRQSVEPITWITDFEDDEEDNADTNSEPGKYQVPQDIKLARATLTEAPFAGWKLGVDKSGDKWDQGALTYWIVASLNSPYVGIPAGGTGFWSLDEAELDMLKRLIKIKNDLDDNPTK